MELSQTSFCNLNGVIQSHALLLPSLPTVVAKGKFFSNHNVGGQSQAQVLVRVLWKLKCSQGIEQRSDPNGLWGATPAATDFTRLLFPNQKNFKYQNISKIIKVLEVGSLYHYSQLQNSRLHDRFLGCFFMYLQIFWKSPNALFVKKVLFLSMSKQCNSERSKCFHASGTDNFISHFILSKQAISEIIF